MLVVNGSYSEGFADGLWTFYYANGIKESEGAFVADKNHLIKNFTTLCNIENVSTGEIYGIRSTSDFHSPPDGEWNFYNNQGILLKSFKFDKGIIVYMEYGEHLSH